MNPLEWTIFEAITLEFICPAIGLILVVAGLAYIAWKLTTRD